MKKLAKVLEYNNDGTAKIILYKHNKCAGCGNCNQNPQLKSIITADNPINAKANDLVYVDIHKRFLFNNFFILYLLPLIMFIFGLRIGMFLFPDDKEGGVYILFAFISLMIAIIIILIYRRNNNPASYNAKIIKKI